MKIRYIPLTLSLLIGTLTACQSANELGQKVELNNTQTTTLPQGYALLKTIKGDLNQDNREDFVFVVQKKDKNNWAWSDVQQKKVNRNRRGLIIYLSQGEEYSKVKEYLSLLYSENEEGGVYFPPEIMTEIQNKTLNIAFYHGRYGAWKYTFRWQEDDFYLIGYDESTKSDYEDDNMLHFDAVSYNFLTRKKQIKTAVGFDAPKDHSVYKERWEILPNTPLEKLSAIKKLEEFRLE